MVTNSKSVAAAQKLSKSPRAIASVDPVVIQRRNRSSSVQSLPRRSPPRWLKYLFTLQNGSSIVALVLLTVLLSLYGWTVDDRFKWNQSDNQLKELQKTERQLTAKSEVLKNQIAQQAEQPEMNLLQPKPEEAIILQITPEPPQVNKNDSPHTTAAKKLTSLPLGY